MQNSRRDFLQQLGAAGLVSLSGLPPAFLSRAVAADTNQSEQILVLIQLAGGNDGLNTVIPYTDEVYYRNRPSLGIGRGQVLKLNSELGLHPGMTGMKELFDENLLAVVQGIGYPNPDRSHFRSMDIWQSARPESDDTRDGWIGRAMDVSLGTRGSTKLPAIAIGTENLPLSLLSQRISIPTIRDPKRYQLNTPGKAPDRKSFLKLVETATKAPAPDGSELEFVRATQSAAVTSAEALKSVSAGYKAASPYPENGLGQRLKTVAQMIASDFGPKVYFVSHGGFDTHSQQENAHATLLTELSSAVTAFTRDLQGHKLADKVLTVTFSEFGRRVKENGSLGTDHGAASQMFAISPKVKAGIHGDHPSLTDLDDGDLKFHTDFRSIYASVLENWMKVDSRKVLGNQFKTVPFV